MLKRWKFERYNDQIRKDDNNKRIILIYDYDKSTIANNNKLNQMK